MRGNFVEISQAISPDGRRRVRLALHSIYPDETECNLNGITYLEEYTRENADSVIGMPICAAFLDDDKDIPYDHGMTGQDEYMPLFENSVQVGTADGWSIEDIVINGETKKVLVADGYINAQRYPKFVEWLEEQKHDENDVYGSVEFVGTKENKRIMYKDGKTIEDKFRVPISYVYSGYCILTVKPSDSSAIMVELNQLNIDKNKKEEKLMDKEQMELLVSKVEKAIAETNSKNSEFEIKIAELNSKVENKDNEITELNSKLEGLKVDLSEKENKFNEVNELLEQTKVELNESKKENKINELNEALSIFSEDEKKYAEIEINQFKEDWTKVEVNSIITKINAEIGKKLKENQIAETNSAKKDKADDIFSFVDDTSNSEIVDFDDMFA